MNKIVIVYCPVCDKQFEIELEESSSDLEPGGYLLCNECTENSVNGDIKVKQSDNIDMYPGDS